MSADPIALIKQKTFDWWKDHRRNWCAYCGVEVRSAKPAQLKNDSATRDHVIPRKHSGRHITIASCHECNAKKGALGLPEFMLTDYFVAKRQKRRPNQWSLRDLWLVMALAAVEQARHNADAWPTGKKAAPGQSRAD